MREEQKFYDSKSALTSSLIEFWKQCELDGRDAQDEIDDCVADAERDCKP